ncbi:flavin reductase family protein [Halorarius halobius]|uniref:flavin reductase family protein n=1 Tax=Halorarius halobius TaxID=2962671 RepID=UPI0020CE906E|nr:flavin reductase family protein [Halorarius halobius]
MLGFEPGTDDRNSTYRVLGSVVTPRPIGWISTQSTDGEVNLAPYSFFNAVSFAPPVLMFAAITRTDGLTDTARNVLDTGEFVASLVTEPLAAAMDETSAPLDAEENEFEHAGLETAPSVRVDAPRVAEAAAALECSLYDSLDIEGNSTVVFGRVEYVHLDESILTDGTVDARKIRAVGRIGGPYYTETAVMDLERAYYE